MKILKNLVQKKWKNIEENLEIKFDLYEEKSVWNKWRYGYSILGGTPFEVLKQSLLVQLIKINKNEYYVHGEVNELEKTIIKCAIDNNGIANCNLISRGNIFILKYTNKW